MRTYLSGLVLLQISVAIAATLAVEPDPEEYELTEDDGYFSIFDDKLNFSLQKIMF